MTAHTCLSAPLSTRPQSLAGLQRQPLRQQRSVVASSCRQAGLSLDRRTAALSLAPLLFPAAALALVPDQDEEDDKLIQQAKANRGQRLSGEKSTETRYSVTSGANKNGDIGSIQRAVNRLGRSGAAIAAGKLSDLATTINDPWVDQFKTAALDLTTTDDAKSSLDSALSGISSLGSSKEITEAKQKYTTTVKSFISWVDLVGVQNSLKGL